MWYGGRMWSGLGPRSRRVGPAVLRLAAVLALLLAIVADLSADARCHPVPRARNQAGFSVANAPSEQDPCGANCVPDCFCCSALSLGPADLTPVTATPGVPAAPPAEAACPPGIDVQPYRPPIASSLN